MKYLNNAIPLFTLSCWEWFVYWLLRYFHVPAFWVGAACTAVLFWWVWWLVQWLVEDEVKK